MRNGVIAALLAISTPVLAGPGDRLEASGFLGVDYYGDEIGLGGSPAPEQRPQTAPTFGGRLTYVPLQIGGDIHLDLGVEVELAFTPSWTGYGFDGPRPSVFAPVLGYHGNLIVRLGGGWVQPHITAGGGGETILAESMYMARETDPVFLWGVGATFPMHDRWQLRFDARQGVMEAIQGGTTETYEAHFAIGTRFGAVKKREVAPTVEVVEAPKPPPPPKDSDGDGLLDPDDACPARAETMNGFEDEDGCADDDNDGDGVADARDKCPADPENKNGIDDEDGCPDEIPPQIHAALSSATVVKFERNRARLSRTAKAKLDKALVMMLNNPRVKFTITAHPEKDDDKAKDLASKRADVVRWYLTEQGVAAGNLTTVVGSVVTDRKAPIIELSVTQ